MSASAGLPSGKSAAEIDRFGRDPMGRARRKTPDRVSGFRVPVPGKSSRELAGWAGLRLRESAKSTDGLDNGRILAALEAPRASHPSGERWGVRRRSGSPSRPRGIRRSIRNETGRAGGESASSQTRSRKRGQYRARMDRHDLVAELDRPQRPFPRRAVRGGRGRPPRCAPPSSPRSSEGREPASRQRQPQRERPIGRS